MDGDLKLGSAISELTKLRHEIREIASGIFIDDDPVGFLSHGLVNDRNKAMKKRLLELVGEE